jgi:dihydropteroate synthase
MIGFSRHKTLNLRGELLDTSYPRIMGILNITPDSFFSGSRIKDNLREKADQMQAEGADILDVGGYSTRPGAAPVSKQEELDRVLPVVEYLIKNYPRVRVSVDTFRAEVARKSVGAGASIINDVSGGNLDEQMFDTVAELSVPYVLMHMRGTPETMSGLTDYKNITEDVIRELGQKLALLRSKGVKDIVIDPGFGFAKTISQNFELMKQLDALEILECPLLIGISRKKMIYESLLQKPENSLNGTTVLNSYALYKGASVLRVHDVKEAAEIRNLLINKGLCSYRYNR